MAERSNVFWCGNGNDPFPMYSYSLINLARVFGMAPPKVGHTVSTLRGMIWWLPSRHYKIDHRTASLPAWTLSAVTWAYLARIDEVE